MVQAQNDANRKQTIEKAKLADKRRPAVFFQTINPLKSSSNLNNNSWELTIPKELRNQVLEENHDDKQAGHLGMEKTYARIAENYFWPGMYFETLKYVKECYTCQRIKPKIDNKIGLMGKRIIEEP